MTNLVDETNDDLFKIHDVHTRQLHQDYLQHLGLIPKFNLKKVRKEIELKSKEESLNTTATDVLEDDEKEILLVNDEKKTLTIPENVTLKALDERDAINHSQHEAISKRRLHQALSIIGTLMLSSGAAMLIGPKLGVFLPIPLPNWVTGSFMLIILSSLTSFAGLHAAKMRQIKREQRLDVREIAEIVLIEQVLLVERKIGEPDLTKELNKFAQLRWGNKKIDDAELEEKVSLIGLGFMILLLTFSSVYKFGNSMDGVLTGIILSLFSSAFIVMNLLPLSSESLDIPPISDFNVIDPIEVERRHNAELKEAERKYEAGVKNKSQLEDTKNKEKKGQLVQALDAKAKSMEEEEKEKFDGGLQDFYRKEEKIYQDLRVANSRWEELRGFNSVEINYMIALRKVINNRVIWLYVFSIISALLATYPASIFTSEVIDIGFSYTSFGKFSPIVWAIWTMLMVGAEFLIVSSFINIRKFNYYKEVLLQNYDLSIRKKGMTYIVLRKKDAKRQAFGSKMMMTLGIFILLIELVANMLYINQQASDISILTFVISLVPFLLLVGFAFMAADQKYQLSYLNDSLGYGDLEQASRKIPKTYKERNTESKRKIEEIETQIGPRPVTGKKNRNNE